MTTFQAVLHAILHGFAFLQPVGEAAHHRVTSGLLSWPAPPDAALGAMALGTALALLLTYRHEWASALSSLLRVLLLWKRPMTFDERLPFFLVLATLPPLAALCFTREEIAPYLEGTSDWVYLLFWLAPGALFLFAEDHSKRNRGLLDWNWLDCLGLGLALALGGLVPAFGFSAAIVLWAALRHFGREGTIRFLPYVLFPLAAAEAWRSLREVDFSAGEAASGMSWMTFGIAGLVAFFSALLALGGLLKSAERGSLRGVALYRLAVPVLAALVMWIQRR